MLRRLLFGDRKAHTQLEPDARTPEGRAPDLEQAGLSPMMPHLSMLISSSGGAVFADESDGHLLHIPGDPAGREPRILALVPSEDGQVLFLCPADAGRSLRLEHDPHAAALLSYRIETMEDGHRLIRHPTTTLLLSAAPFKPGPVRVVCNRDRPGDWETFRLTEVETRDTGTVPPQLQAVAMLYRRGLTADAIAAWMHDEDPVILGRCCVAVLRLLGLDMLRLLSERLAGDAVLRARLSHACADDIWLGRTLREVAGWMDDRPPLRTLRIGTEYDFLGRNDGLTGEHPEVGASLVTGMRSQIGPRRVLAVITILANEGVYVLEWIAHHIALGVDHFFIYTSGVHAASIPLLTALSDNGIVTWITDDHAEGTDPFRKVCGHALSCLPQTLDYRWTIVIDIDEFIVLDAARYSSLPGFIEAREAVGTDAITLSRLLFRPLHQTNRVPRPLPARLLQCNPPNLRAVKMIFRTGCFVSSFPHEPVPMPGRPTFYHDAAGELHHGPGRPGSRSEATPKFENAWINVYKWKSVEEFIWSSNVISPRDLVNHIRSLDDEGLIEDDSASAHLPGLAAELVRMRALPGIAEADAHVIRTFREQVNARKSELSSRMQADPILRGVAAAWLIPSDDASVLDVS